MASMHWTPIGFSWHLPAGRQAAVALAIVRPHGSADAQLSRSAERVANCCESEVALASRHPQAIEKGLVANGSSRVMATVTAVGQFAHGHRRIQRASGRVEAPGLWMLQRHCPPVGLPPEQHGGVAIADEERTVLWFASVPLTAEEWRPFAQGELLAARGGELLEV